jgi:hypothetical protein
VAKNNPFIKCSPHTEISEDPNIQVLEVSIPSIEPITVFNIYNKHEDSSNLYTIPRIFTNILLLEQCIIAGDMNAHHTWWNSHIKLPKRADEIVQIIQTHHLSLLNELNK